MNPYFEHTCQWFGALSCESASLAQCMTMAFIAALAAIAAVWTAGQLAITISE